MSVPKTRLIRVKPRSAGRSVSHCESYFLPLFLNFLRSSEPYFSPSKDSNMPESKLVQKFNMRRGLEAEREKALLEGRKRKNEKARQQRVADNVGDLEEPRKRKAMLEELLDEAIADVKRLEARESELTSEIAEMRRQLNHGLGEDSHREVQGTVGIANSEAKRKGNNRDANAKSTKGRKENVLKIKRQASSSNGSTGSKMVTLRRPASKWNVLPV